LLLESPSWEWQRFEAFPLLQMNIFHGLGMDLLFDCLLALLLLRNTLRRTRYCCRICRNLSIVDNIKLETLVGVVCVDVGFHVQLCETGLDDFHR